MAKIFYILNEKTLIVKVWPRISMISEVKSRATTMLIVAVMFQNHVRSQADMIVSITYLTHLIELYFN